MSHESVWNSRPRNYGKGARGWDKTAVSAPTRPVSSASTASTSAVSASVRRPTTLASSRFVTCPLSPVGLPNNYTLPQHR
ncbi:hypothetical protein OQA88_1915 [Cercophora sp. LCS_1]